MAIYYLYEKEGSRLHLTIENFIQQMVGQWPAADIDRSPSQTSILSWEISSAQDRGIAGANKVCAGIIDQDLARMILIGNDEMCIEFALWYRSVLPAHISLFLRNNDTVENPIELHSGTTLREIAGFFVQALDFMQAKILRLLLDSGGKALSRVLVEEIEKGGHVPQETFDAQMHSALKELWRKGLISSPGVKWGIAAEERTHSDIRDYVTNPYVLTITEKGILAIKNTSE